MKHQYLSALLIIILLSSCRKPEEFPLEPVITYKSMSTTLNALGYDSKLNILLNFTDGDGDVGYRDLGQNDPIFDDTASQYYNNYNAFLFQFKNNVWISYPTLIPLGGRLPYLTPVTLNKALQGEISCDFDVPLHAIQDTFRLDIFIYDRALHKSNVITTPSFILTTQ